AQGVRYIGTPGAVEAGEAAVLKLMLIPRLRTDFTRLSALANALPRPAVDAGAQVLEASVAIAVAADEIEGYRLATAHLVAHRSAPCLAAVLHVPIGHRHDDVVRQFLVILAGEAANQQTISPVPRHHPRFDDGSHCSIGI